MKIDISNITNDNNVLEDNNINGTLNWLNNAENLVLEDIRKHLERWHDLDILSSNTTIVSELAMDNVQ